MSVEQIIDFCGLVFLVFGLSALVVVIFLVWVLLCMGIYSFLASLFER